MDKNSLRRFLRMLQPNAEVVDNGDWLNTSCPLARWTHQRGTDRNPSFGVHVGTPSAFNCLACHKAGPIPRLLDLLEQYSGDDYRDLKAEISGDELLAPRIHSVWAGDRDTTERDRLGDPLDLEALDLYESAAGHPYLASRGVLPETADELGLLVDPDNKGCERILFPVYSLAGALYGLTGRATNASAVPKVRDYFGLDKRLLLLGSHLLDPDAGGRIVLVEGLFDYALVAQRGWPVVASMHATLTEAQAQILKEIGRPVIVFYDNDKAGWEGREIVKQKLQGFVPVLGVTYPFTKRQVGKGAASDPGSLPDDAIDSMIDSARLL